jgi:hypothetical protein
MDIREKMTPHLGVWREAERKFLMESLVLILFLSESIGFGQEIYSQF